jgi:Kef-type K+ transport system membrane component KefB
MTKNSLLAYVLVLALFGSAIFATIHLGSRLTGGPQGTPIASKVATQETNPEGNAILKGLHRNLQSPLSRLLLQIVLITVVARVSGTLVSKVGQPRVIGEMIAGILLGPSFLGFFSPAMMGTLFPASSMENLRMLSELGVVLFMFLVGTDVHLGDLWKKAHTAIWVSHASIVVPFFLGTVASLYLYSSFAPAGIAFKPFALFMGVAMSITAFPVLARIVQERNMTQSAIGIMSLGCAAVDDATAWCILAVVLALVKSESPWAAIFMITLLVAFVVVMLFLLRPALRRVIPPAITSDKSWAAGILSFAGIAALATEVIGVHALFGAFIAGTIVPAGPLRAYCKEKFESVASSLLLPLFFVFTGLRTQMGLLKDSQSWIACVVVIGAAVLGKLGASALAARWSGMNLRDSFALGALMNTRGLMELIVLNIGYDLGILSSRIFAILILMALTTTFMTSPLLSMVYGKTPGRS